jgi:hypothetical protein
VRVGASVAGLAIMADDSYYFAGDPATESTRRHMERVLKGERRRRWPWLLGMLAGGTALAFWRARRGRRNSELGARSSELMAREDLEMRKSRN